MYTSFVFTIFRNISKTNKNETTKKGSKSSSLIEIYINSSFCMRAGLFIHLGLSLPGFNILWNFSVAVEYIEEIK